MNKKGFTLIELLAVIVILTIIALIAIPIVLNIIKNSNESAILRGAEYYIDAVELSIARNRLDGIKLEGTYNILENGNICNQNDITNEVCNDDKEITIDVKGEIPDNGTVTITNGKIIDINLTYGDKTVINDEDILIFYSPVCVLAPNGDIAPSGLSVGDKYLCKVKDKMEPDFKDGYIFFVLSTNNRSNELITSDSIDKEITSVNLILDRNVYYNSDTDTGLTDENNLGEVAWQSSCTYNMENQKYEGDCATIGPTTAIDYLYNATKHWNKIPSIKINYIEEGSIAYGSIISEGEVTKIIKKDSTISKSYNGLKARLAIYKEISAAGCKLNDRGTCPLWLVNYLGSSSYYKIEDGKVEIKGLSGYWTFYAQVSGNGHAYYVDNNGYLTRNSVISTFYGVRPIITLDYEIFK